MAPVHVTPHKANAPSDPRLRSPFLPMLVDNLFKRSHEGAAAVTKRRDVAGDATAAKSNKTTDLTLGILGAVLTGLFLLWFVAYNIRLATRGELSATYKRQLRCVRERLASAGRGLGSCFRPASWKKLPSGLKWFFSSQNGCWACAYFRAPKNEDGNNGNTNNSGSDDQNTHSRDGGDGVGLGIVGSPESPGGGSGNSSGGNSPFKSHIGPDISHLFKDTDSAAAAMEPSAEMHPALRRDSAMLAMTSAGNAAVAARQHQNPHQLRADNNNNNDKNNSSHPPLRHIMTWPTPPPRSPGQGSAGSAERRQSSRWAMAKFAAAGPGASMAARPLSRYGPLSSHPMDQQRWYSNHQQRQQQHQQHQQQHQHQPRHPAPPPPARGGGPPVLPPDLAGPLMRNPGWSWPTSIGSNYCAELLEHARPWLLWASSRPPEPTFSSTPGPNGALVRNKSRGKRFSWLRDGGRSRRASAVLEGRL